MPVCMLARQSSALHETFVRPLTLGRGPIFVTYAASYSSVSGPMQFTFGNVVLRCSHIQITYYDFMLVNLKYVAQFVFIELCNDTWITVNMLLELIYIRSHSLFFTQA